ncbi:triggering receptor expressed on myeloid cells 3-like [Lepus europaeus]|uniref:triggering receptor expressed on myeloid cells 3-like n=1 Tax=Lepus europaeus TaxID=9983 RepID=UPI002B4667A5|nr:triggering receptor expressed on myeloid cells 3-like [Lepus europaeus]
MEGPGVWGRRLLLLLLLLLLCVPGSQATGGEQEEEQKCLVEGDNLTVSCPYNIMQYATSLKAWQRVGSRGSLETLVRTETRKEDHNRAQAGRYLLEDYPTHAILRVTMADLRRQDVGLYQCVIYLSSQQVVVLYHRIRLVQCQGLWMPATVLACGFILNKSLVFAVLLVFLCRGRAAS